MLLAVAAVLNAASFEEKRSSNEDVPSNLAEAASPELADDSPQEESRDSVEDPADLSKGRADFEKFVRYALKMLCVFTPGCLAQFWLLLFGSRAHICIICPDEHVLPFG